MPRWANDISHAYRYFTSGKETNRAGNAIVRFDPNDTEQMGEIIMRGLGFQPRRATEEWERRQAIKESGDYWDIRREILMRQFGEVVKNKGTQEEKDRVISGIKKFNDEVRNTPNRMKAISGDALKESMMQKLKIQQKEEAGIPREKSNIPIARDVEKYYPRGWPKGMVGAKPVQ